MRVYCENCGEEIVIGAENNYFYHVIHNTNYVYLYCKNTIDDVAKFDVERFREEQLNKILSYGK